MQGPRAVSQAVSQATGVSRQVIRQGLKELDQPRTHPVRDGFAGLVAGGRKVKEKDPTLVADLEEASGVHHAGVTRSCAYDGPARVYADWLKNWRDMGHPVSYPVVAELLHELDYSLQANRKTKEGDKHPDRNAQFEYINAKVQQYIGRRQQPVISVDTKKKRVAGRFQE